MKKFLPLFGAIFFSVLCLSVSASAVVTDNVAAGKSISTTYEVYASGSTSYPASLMVDGNHSQSASTCSILRWSPDGYILVDLGGNYEISGVGLFNYEWAYQYCINASWTVFVSADGQNWLEFGTDTLSVSPASITSAGYDRGNTGDLFYPRHSVFGRYVKLVINEVYIGAGAVSYQAPTVRLYEFEVYGVEQEYSASRSDFMSIVSHLFAWTWAIFTTVRVPGLDISFGSLIVGIFLANLSIKFLARALGLNSEPPDGATMQGVSHRFSSLFRNDE